MRLVPSETTDSSGSTSEFWDNVASAAMTIGWRALGAAAIIGGAIIIAWLLRLLISRVVKRIVEGAKLRANVADTRAIENSPLASVRIIQRTRTLGSILHNIVNVTVVVITLLLVMNVLAPGALGSLALLTAAVGAGLGFGAQNIVKDVLNGILIVAEDQVGIGDVVDLGLATGIVEYVAIRVTHVRDVNGTLWYVRNGEITRIGNMSQGWSRVIIDLAVPADADLPAVEKAMLAAAKSLTSDQKWRTRVLEQPEIWGLESVDGDALVVRLVMKTRATAKDDVAQELRVRLRAAITGLGVDLAQLSSVTLTGLEGAQRVRGANPPTTAPTSVATKKGARPVWKPKKDPAAEDDTP